MGKAGRKARSDDTPAARDIVEDDSLQLDSKWQNPPPLCRDICEFVDELADELERWLRLPNITKDDVDALLCFDAGLNRTGSDRSCQQWSSARIWLKFHVQPEFQKMFEDTIRQLSQQSNKTYCELETLAAVGDPEHRSEIVLLSFQHGAVEPSLEYLRKVSSLLKAEFNSDARRLPEDKKPEREDEVSALDAATPPLDQDSLEWVDNKKAARLEGIAVRTLSDYRGAGIQNAAGTLGQDNYERVWRRPGTPSSHPWYLKSTLRSERDKRK